MAKPSLSTAQRCCDPLKVPLRNPRLVSHILDWNAAVELLLRYLREQTPPMLVGGIREHEYRPPRFRVRQSHSVNDEGLHRLPDPDQLGGQFSGRNRPVSSHSFSATLGAHHALLQEHKRPNDLRHPRQRRKNRISSPAISGCLMAANPFNRSGSCLTCPCENTFQHHVMLVSKKVYL